MSGTSGDGIDASIIQSDGEKHINIVSNHYCEYENEIKNEIKALKRKINSLKDLKAWSKDINFLEKKITELHVNFVLKILKETKNLKAYNGVDVLGFHGQTIYHSANEKISKRNDACCTKRSQNVTDFERTLQRSRQKEGMRWKKLLLFACRPST